MNTRPLLSILIFMPAFAGMVACDSSDPSTPPDAAESSSDDGESGGAPEEGESDSDDGTTTSTTADGENEGTSDAGESGESTGAPGEVEVVDFVELERYLGTWYEIASYPSPFSGSCVGTTATYTANEDGTVGVLNRCTIGSADGQMVEIEGYAEVADPETNAKLLVYFNGGEGAEYWVVDLDDTEGSDPYAWAVVSNSTQSSLFVLSRAPEMSEELYQSITEELAARGWDLELLELTEQPDAG